MAVSAMNICFVLALCLAKLSIVIFFLKSTVGRPPRIACTIVVCLTALWALISVLGLAFQCKFPNPWLFINNSCFDRLAFWHFIVIADIVTDVCILILPFYTFRFLQIPRGVRLKIIAPFCARLLIIPIAILRLIYLVLERNTTDPPFDTFQTSLLTTVQLNAAIIISCIPFSRLLLSNVQSGLLTSSLRTHAPNFDGGTAGGFLLADVTQGTRKNRSGNSSGNRPGNKSGKESQSSSFGENLKKMPWNFKADTISSHTQVEGNYKQIGIDERNVRAKGRRVSPTESEQHIIRQTTEWIVDHGEADSERVN